MANTIDSNLKNDIILNMALQGYVDTLLPLAAFSANLSPAAGVRGQSVTVGLVGTQTAGDYAGSYKTNPDSSIDDIQVTINKHKFKTVHITDTEYANSSILNLEDFGYQAGAAVAAAVVADVLSLVTLANYGAAIFTGAASGFDTDDVVDLRTACNTAKIPKRNRILALDGAYTAGLLKDADLKNVANSGSAETLRNGNVGQLSGFRTFESEVIPGNSENLIGFCGGADGIALAMRYLAPQEDHQYAEARPLVDADSGLTLGMRRWYDNDSGTRYLTFESIYGKSVGRAAALKRLVSA